MNNQTHGDWSLWATPFVELQQMMQSNVEKITREYISYFSDTVATAVKSTQILPRVTSPEDFAMMQMKLLSQQNAKNLEFIENVFQIWHDAAQSQGQWTEEKVSSAIKNKTTTASKKHTEGT